jgi:hypothetical protein
MRNALAFLLCLLLAVPASAEGNLGRSIRGAFGGTKVVSCPYGASDPCTNFTVNSVTFTPPANGAFSVAPLVATQGLSNFYQYATNNTSGFGSGQTWSGGAHPWSFNAPGVDYKIGYDTTVALKDPTNSSNLPTGCTYSATGRAASNLYWPTVTCGAVANLTVSGLDFSNQSGHDCVTLNLLANVTGTVTIKNNHFSSCTNMSGMEVNASVDTTNGVLTVTAVRHQTATDPAFTSGIADGMTVFFNDYTTPKLGTFSIGHAVLCNGIACTGAGGTGTYAITVNGPWVGQSVAAQRMSIQSATTTSKTMLLLGTPATNLYIYNNLFEGYGEPTNTQCNGYPCLGSADQETWGGGGYYVFAYNAVLNTAERPLNRNHAGETLPTFSYHVGNYVAGIVTYGYGIHGEILLESSTGVAGVATIAVENYGYNVFFSPNYTGGSSSIIYGSDGRGLATPSLSWTSYVLDHNVILGNYGPSSSIVIDGMVYIDGAQIPALTVTNNYIDPTGTRECWNTFTSAISTITQSGNFNLVNGNATNNVPTAVSKINCL